MLEFPHIPPKGFSYEFETFKRGVIRIWCVNHYQFSYTTKQVKSVWGFYKPSKRAYHAPINSMKVGDVVDINKTTPYSAMPILKPMRPSILDFI